MEREELIDALVKETRPRRRHGRHDDSGATVWGVLYYIHHHSDTEVNPSDLCAEFGVTTARITAVLNELENAGYIERRSSAGDRRRVCVYLTTAGTAHVEEHNLARRKDIEQLIDAVGEHDALVYLQVSQKLKEIRDAHHKCASGTEGSL